MPVYEVAVTLKARKYMEITAESMKGAIELAKMNFNDLWASLDDELQKREGLSIDEKATFMVTNIIEK